MTNRQTDRQIPLKHRKDKKSSVFGISFNFWNPSEEGLWETFSNRVQSVLRSADKREIYGMTFSNRVQSVLRSADKVDNDYSLRPIPSFFLLITEKAWE